MTITTNKKIPFFNYPHLFNEYGDGLKKVIDDVTSRGAYILQKDLTEFEADLAKFLNVKSVIGVANGTDSLELILKACDIGQGDEVIFSTHTYIATASAIHFVGATPVPVECGSDHMIDVTKIKNAITKKTKAIMPTQLNGRTCQMDEIQKIAKEHGLLIIEDAAQALGSQYKKQFAGTFGIAGSFSFYPAKLLGCFGDGGGIVTNDLALADKILELRDHGRNKDGLVVRWGRNSRLDNLQAAVLSYKLKFFNEAIARRRELAGLYQKYLGDLSEVKLPPAPETANHFDVYQNYEIEAENRDELKKYLLDQGVGTIIQWAGKLVHEFKDLNFNVSLPYSEKMIRKALLLPMNTALTNDDVASISEIIKKFYKK